MYVGEMLGWDITLAFLGYGGGGGGMGMEIWHVVCLLRGSKGKGCRNGKG
jgi:hypothetical protein